MSTVSSRHHEPTRANCPHVGCTRVRLLIGIVILALARGSEALCAENMPFAAHPAGLPDMDLPIQPVAQRPLPMAATVTPFREAFAAPRLEEEPGDWSKEFRPRRPSVNEGADDSRIPTEAPMVRSTTVWQRLSEYRSRDRVRVLTLWESGASTVSLQAGKKGSPSLQWTSRLMNHGGATRGLLDQLFAVSIAGANSGLHGGARAANAPQTSIKPTRMEAVSK